MEQQKLRFVVTDDLDLEFTLIQEAWIGEREVADVRNVNGVWQVSFFPDGQQCQLSWNDFTEIYRSFSAFVTEQSTNL